MVEKLGKYRIDGMLGKGAMGVVYKAFDPHIERTVAIKTIRKELLSDSQQDEVIARFKNEAQAAGRLIHPNIVLVYEYGEDSESAFITMEFVDGTPLNTLLIVNKAADPAHTTVWMNDLLNALDYAHSQGVIHRDIKPANLLITRTGHVKVSDFGIARMESSTLTQAGSMIGTPSYMSPEQFRGETVDRRSDVFSAGVVLYQLLTGTRPFVGSTSVVMQQILNETALPPSHLNPSLGRAFDSVLEKVLAKAPADRYVTAGDFLNAINAAMRDIEVDSDATRLNDNDLTILASEVQSVMFAAQRGGRHAENATLGSNAGAGTGHEILTAWKLEVLPTIDALLSRQIGPMAKLILKKVAAKAEDLNSLCDLLMPHIPSELGRLHFQEAINELKNKSNITSIGTRTKSNISNSSQQTSSLSSSIDRSIATVALGQAKPVDAAFAEAATRKLLVFIGPIAGVVVKRTLRLTQNKVEFLRLLSEQISSLPERSRFLIEAGSI